MADLIQALDVVETMSTGMMAEEYGGRVARALGFQYFHYRSAQLEMTNGPYSWSARYRQENYYQSDPIRRRAFPPGTLQSGPLVCAIGVRKTGHTLRNQRIMVPVAGSAFRFLVPMVTGHRFVSVMVSVISKPTVYGRHRCCMLSLRYLTEACGKAFFLAIYI